ncbi:DVU3141 family protein [Zobellella maritima]|uniref:DVU3141 family protein n=1 Tax=Zobellella maritima TaxID=2059725 RepID=UPI001E3DFE2F|nr:DVU3141 family protein [Zobellella maritima]
MIQNMLTDSAGNSPEAISPESDLNNYLSSAVTGGVASLKHSPWGSNVQVRAGAPYFAASGRTCRKLDVTLPSGDTQQHIVCRTGQNTWTPVRPVTHLLAR